MRLIRLWICLAVPGFSQPSGVALLQQSVAQSELALRSYTWRERTAILQKGDVRTTEESICREGPNGEVQRRLLPQRSAAAFGPLDSASKVIELIHAYAPPTSLQLDAALKRGDVSISYLTGGLIEVRISGYLKQGDTVVFTLDSSPRIVSLAVVTYADDPSDHVAITASFKSLPDGTPYASTVVLNAPKEQIEILCINADHQIVLFGQKTLVPDRARPAKTGSRDRG